MTTIISALKAYLLTYPELTDGASLNVDFVGPDMKGYNIAPLPGEKVLESYIDGGSMRAYPFSFQSVESTADELARMEANGFYEDFSAGNL